MACGRFIDVSEEQLKNALTPIDVTCGRFIDVSEEHTENASPPIVVACGNETEARNAQL